MHISPCPSMVKMTNAETIGAAAFKFWTMDTVQLPPNLVKIERLAFVECEFLAHVNFTNCKHLEVIEKQAFEGCYAFESIKLPPSVREIQSYAFDGCSNLKKVDLSECHWLSQGGIYDTAFEHCHADLVVQLPANVTLAMATTAEQSPAYVYS